MRKNDKFYYAEAVRAWQSWVSRSPDPSVSGFPTWRNATFVAINEALEVHGLALLPPSY
ncbi:hypothetical protein QUA70_16690 [Microcoleus sp. LAD1_D5]|uniref:hypothetical protein n=1 Tax=unclassified Microcoleus TaxID=2642155 RepID=UPI002FD08DFC